MTRKLLFPTRLKQLVAVVFLLTAVLANAQAPTITSFSPTSGPVGSTVTITGTNLSKGATVLFRNSGGTTVSAAAVTINSDTSITAIVPTNAATNIITIYDTGGTLNGSSATNFTVTAGSVSINAAPPTITSFSPASGVPGTTLTITGSGFSTTNTDNVVFIGASRAEVTSSTATQIEVTIPYGATHSVISVTNLVTKSTVTSSKVFFPTWVNPTPETIVANSFKVTQMKSTTTPASVTSILGSTTTDFIAGGAIGDFDLDGKVDLIKASNTGKFVRVYRNIATPSASLSLSSFESTAMDFNTNFSTTTSAGPSNLAVGDLNNDGKLDVVICNGAQHTGMGEGTINILINNSTGPSNISFLPAQNLLSPRVSRVQIADMDGDGLNDIILTLGYSNKIFVHRNMTVLPSTNIVMIKTGYSLATLLGGDSSVIGDLNNDGKLDIISSRTNGGNNEITIAQNTSTPGTISFNTPFTTTVSGITTPHVGLSDLDNDGKLDVVCGGNGDSGTALRNTFSSGNLIAGDFTATSIANVRRTNSRVHGISFADINGDGKPDPIMGYTQMSGSIDILGITTNNLDSNANFDTNKLTATNTIITPLVTVPPTIYYQTANYGVDLNNDGKPDIVSFETGSIFIAQNQINETPLLSTTGAVTAFTTCSGSPSVSQSFTVSSRFLDAAIVLSAVTGYEYSLNNTDFSSTLSFTPSARTATNTTVYVRLKSDSTGTPTGTLNISSATTGITTRTVSLTGTVLTVSAPSATTRYFLTLGDSAPSLTATASSGHSLQWYTVATNGTASLSAPTVDVATAGSTSYYVSQKNDSSGCESSRKEIKVIVYGFPAAPTVANTTINYCVGATSTAVAATAVSGHELLWYTQQNGGTASSTAPTPSTATATALNYYVSQKAIPTPYTLEISQSSAGTGISNYINNLGQTFQVPNDIILNTLGFLDIYFSAQSVTSLKIYDRVNGTLLATANSTYSNTNTGVWIPNVTFSFANQNLRLNGGQTYYFELTTSTGTMYLRTKTTTISSGNTYEAGVSVTGKEFLFKLTSNLEFNTLESTRTAITVNVNAIPTISGIQNMNVGGANLQLTGSGTPASSGAWDSSNTAVATISNTGEVTPVGLGSTVITYTNIHGCSTSQRISVSDCTKPFGNALNFDGSDDHVSIPNAVSSNISSAFTLEAWVYPTAVNANVNIPSTIISKIKENMYDVLPGEHAFSLSFDNSYKIS